MVTIPRWHHRGVVEKDSKIFGHLDGRLRPRQLNMIYECTIRELRYTMRRRCEGGGSACVSQHGTYPNWFTIKMQKIRYISSNGVVDHCLAHTRSLILELPMLGLNKVCLFRGIDQRFRFFLLFALHWPGPLMGSATGTRPARPQPPAKQSTAGC